MKFEKILKILGQDTVNEMSALSQIELRTIIVEANQAMQIVKDELEENEKYQELKESIKAISSGKKEVDKRQKARIDYALRLMTGPVHEGN